MRLIEVRIRNFRSYKNETSIPIQPLTALIGKNDVGKSSILEALEIYFNGETVELDQDDLTKGAEDSEIRITCIFDDLPERIVIDDSSETSLAGEFLLNESQKLEIIKVFSVATKKPKVRVFAGAMHPTHPSASDLLQLKIADLKARAKDLGVPTTKYDARSKSSIRAAIWSSTKEIELAKQEIELEKEDAGKIWNTLKQQLPLFALFQSDRESKDQDSEVQDPLQIAVKAALREVESELEAIKRRVEAQATDVAARTLAKLNEMAPDLGRQLLPRFSAEPKWDSQFKLGLIGENGIPINKRGSGFRRLLLLNFFRAMAEEKRHEKGAPGIIYAFEEPETSQHPAHQKLLLNAFKDIAERQGHQIILTTHVPGIAALLDVDAVRFITRNEQNLPTVKAFSDDVFSQVADELGIMPDHNVLLLVCVEGPNDISGLRALNKLARIDDPSLVDLEKDRRVEIVPLGGGTLGQWVNRRFLSKMRVREFHLYDRDVSNPPAYQAAVNEVRARANGDTARLTNKRALDNYVHSDAILRTLNVNVHVTDVDDIPQRLANAAHIGKGKAKARIAAECISAMTLQEFMQVDQGGEVRGWFTEMTQALDT